MKRHPTAASVLLVAAVLTGLPVAMSAAEAADGPADPAKVKELIGTVRAHREAMATRRAAELKERGAQWVRQRLAMITEPLGGQQLEPAAELPANVTAEQVSYLIESLGEAMVTADVPLLESSLQGLRAAGQVGAQLLKSIDDATHEATLRNVWARVRIDVWSLAARASAGDARARLRLKAWAAKPLIEDGTDLEKIDIVSDRATAEAWRKADALLALAFLKDEQAAELARRVLDHDLTVVAFKSPQEWRFNLGWGIWGAPQADRAVRALFVAGAERAEIMKRIQDPEKKPAHRMLMLWGLAEALRDDGPEAAKPLVEAYQMLAGAWLKTITENVAYTERFVMLGPLDTLPPHKEGLEALEKVRQTMAAPFRPFMDPQVTAYRRRLGVTDTAVKPPPPPPEDPGF